MSTEYTVVNGETIEELSEDVMNLMSLGWKCQGGVAVERLQGWDYPNLYQAMTRDNLGDKA